MRVETEVEGLTMRDLAEARVFIFMTFGETEVEERSRSIDRKSVV